MDQWIMRNRSFEISVELTKLLAEQTEFLTKSTHSAAEVEQYKQSCDRVRELFDELASKAA
jgi:hypothetical protein